jgi:hypothetical protein
VAPFDRCPVGDRMQWKSVAKWMCGLVKQIASLWRVCHALGQEESIMTESPKLHLGWRQDVSDARVPVYLNAKEMTAHTAIIAQSGSGKSFMLGRLLEEIVLKTRARVLILDPNSDFARFSTVDAHAWEDPGRKPWFDQEDTKTSFSGIWDQLRFSVLTQRSPVAEPNTEIAPVSISWPPLAFAEKAAYLGLSLRTTPAECHVLQLAERAQQDFQRMYGGNYDLTHWDEFVACLWSCLSQGGAPMAGWPYETVVKSFSEKPSAAAALTVDGRMLHLLGLGIWDRTSQSGSLQERMEVLGRGHSAPKVICLDLGSLERHEQQHVATAAALNALWNGARASWLEAMREEASQDKRCPVFVVIDEAHNLAPKRAISASIEPVIDSLVRIAMEGRKYGLFLILVTQRPGRLNNSLISQCENLCLMKMSNFADLEFVQKSFGFLSPGLASKALTFKKGDALVAGRFIEEPRYIRSAPRRTTEGGRSLQDFWLQLPQTPASGS